MQKKSHVSTETTHETLAPAKSSAQGIMERIMILEEMKNKGLITTAEYDWKKQKLLKQL